MSLATGLTRWQTSKATWVKKRGFTDEDVLQRLANGETNKAVARALGCKRQTVSRIAAAHAQPVAVEPRETPWSEEAVAYLRSAWAEGKSTGEIGRRLGFSKSAVCGKADRLDLPARPRMFHTKPEDRQKVLKEAKPIVRKSLLHSLAPKRRGKMPKEMPPLPPVEEKVVPKPVCLPPPVPKPTNVYQFRRVRECLWIGGGDGTPLVTCSNGAEPGSRWCSEHRRSMTQGAPMRKQA